jgi:hypothetical protein
MQKISIAVDNGCYQLEWVDTALKVRRIGEVTNQVCGTHPYSRIRASLAFIYRHFSKCLPDSALPPIPP